MFAVPCQCDLAGIVQLVVAVLFQVGHGTLDVEHHHALTVGETGLLGVELLGTAVAVLVADSDHLGICQMDVELFFGQGKQGVKAAVVWTDLGVSTMGVYPCAAVAREPVVDFANVEGDVFCQLDLAPFTKVKESGQIHDTGVGILAHGLGGGDGGADGAAAALIEILGRAVVHSAAFNTVGGEDPGGHQERFGRINQAQLRDAPIELMGVIFITDQIQNPITVEANPVEEAVHVGGDQIGGVLVTTEICSRNIALGDAKDETTEQRTL